MHRRKYLRGVLASMLKGQFEKPLVDELLAAFGFSSDVRAEQLDVSSFIALAEAVRQAAST
jgi:16S rRNA A1518/A1519 N6-dimethyltransferase RsmA/KsgA/DIM1 with predicted DNA glycosylase/AP lyase activity